MLTFDHDPVQGDFDQLFKLRLPGAKARWLDDATVMVSSPPQLGGGGAFARGVYKNAPLHRWFRRAAAPFLTDLHQKGGLKKVTVRTG